MARGYGRDAPPSRLPALLPRAATHLHMYINMPIRADVRTTTIYHGEEARRAGVLFARLTAAGAEADADEMSMSMSMSMRTRMRMRMRMTRTRASQG